MHRLVFAVSLSSWLLLLVTAAAAKDPIKFDPAARARLVSRFVAPDAFVVAHVDVTRLKIEPLFDMLKDIAPGNAQQIELTQATVTDSVDMFLKAGGQEAFVVLSPSLSPLLVVPLPADADEASILAVLGQAPLETTEKLAGAIVAGSEASVAPLRDAKPAARTELAAAFTATGATVAQLLLIPTEDNRKVVEQLLPNLPADLGGGSTKPLSRGLNWLALGIDSAPKLTLRLVADTSDAKSAGELNALLGSLLDALFKRADFAKTFPNQAGLRKLLDFKTVQNQLVLELSGGQLLEQLKPTLEQARVAAKRTQSMNNLKQLALAMHNYHDVNKSFPPAALSKGGKPLLSWRVLVLPYIEENQLFQEFHLDEPWDSEHNKKLIPRMPTVLKSPFSQVDGQGRTVYLTPRGADTAFPGQEALKLQKITDGTSHTIMLVEADDEHAVPWTKPDDWDFDPEQTTRGLRLVNDAGYLAGFCDGSTRLLGKNIKPAVLRMMITRAGGEPIPH